jgi:O-acetylserine/cysteine efflux transporter
MQQSPLLLSIFLLQEKLSAYQRCTMGLAFVGVLLLGYARYQSTLPFLPLGLALLGAAGFALGNLALKKAGKVDMFGFTVWMSAVPPVPLLLLSFILEGGQMGNTIAHFSWNSIFALLFIALIGTLFALGTWGKLLALYPAAVVAPFSLLTPVFGMLGGFLILGEQYDLTSVIASSLIVAALIVNTYAAHITQR